MAASLKTRCQLQFHRDSGTWCKGPEKTHRPESLVSLRQISPLSLRRAPGQSRVSRQLDPPAQLTRRPYRGCAFADDRPTVSPPPDQAISRLTADLVGSRPDGR